MHKQIHAYIICILYVENVCERWLIAAWALEILNSSDACNRCIYIYNILYTKYYIIIITRFVNGRTDGTSSLLYYNT